MPVDLCGRRVALRCRSPRLAGEYPSGGRGCRLTQSFFQVSPKTIPKTGNYPGMDISQIRISEVWRALGGGELQRNRGRAWWRNGDGWNVSLDDAKGAFYDHARGAGGGVLDLIQLVRGGSRAEAMEWLKGFAGVESGPAGRPRALHTSAQRAEAKALVAWHQARTEHLRCNLAIYCSRYHTCKKWLIDHESEIEFPESWQLTAEEIQAGEINPRIAELLPPRLPLSWVGTPRWQLMMMFQNDAWAEFQRFEAELEAFRRMSDEEIFAMFQQQRDEPECRDFHFFRDGRHMCDSGAGEEFKAWWREIKIRHAADAGRTKAAGRRRGLQ